MTAQNPASDFETLGRQVWDAWSRQWAGAAAPTPAAPPVPGMEGLQTYLGWMRQIAASAMGQAGHGFAPVTPWAGMGMPGPGASLPPGLDALRDLLETPAFGYGREQQAHQQALMRALLDYQEASARYQQLVARAQAEGAERLQRKLAEPGFPGATSLKAMYDLWVDAVEEAYAEIALSDEFREAYAAQTNTQMRVRQLQLQLTEQWCREAGLPTRSEVDTLGQRLQELRRELRRMQGARNTNAAAASDGPSAVTARRGGASAKAPKARSATSKAKPAAKAPLRRAPRKPR